MKHQLSHDRVTWFDWPPRWFRIVSGSAVGGAQELLGLPAVFPWQPDRSSMAAVEYPITTRVIPEKRWYEVQLLSRPGGFQRWRGVAYNAEDAATQARIWSTTDGPAGTVTCVTPCGPEGP